MGMRDALRTIIVWCSLVIIAGDCFGAPDTTMSITPACTAGTTITCADETTRNNNVSTTYNSHSHTDISQTANTLNVGDGAAGNKNVCFNAADATDRCIRFDDTNNLILVDNPTAGTFNQILTYTGTAGIAANLILVSDGTGPIRAFTSSPPADDQALVADSASAGTWRSLPNCTDTGGNHLNYTQSTNSLSCGTTSSSVTVADRVHRTAGDVTTTSTTLVDFTGASITLTTGANPVLVGFSGACQHSDATSQIALGVQLDNTTNVLGTTGIVYQIPVAAETLLCAISVMTGDLTAASHTFDFQWSTSAATATMSCGTNNPCNFWVVEVTD